MLRASVLVEHIEEKKSVVCLISLSANDRHRIVNAIKIEIQRDVINEGDHLVINSNQQPTGNERVFVIYQMYFT